MNNNQLRFLNQINSSIHTPVIKAFSDVAQPVDLLEVTNNIFSLLRSEYYQSHNDYIPSFSILVDVTAEGSTDNIFGADNYMQHVDEKGILNSSNFIEVDLKGNLITKKINDVVEDLDSIESLSLTNQDCIFFHIRGNELFLFGKGTILKHISDVNNLVNIRRFDNKISSIDVKLVLETYKVYFNSEITPSVYWDDKSKRILVSKPEKLLAQYFISFLKNKISDADITCESLVDGSDDKMDVRVMNFNTRKLSIYEVKWIGRSKGSTYINERSHKRANDGIEQLHIYINKEHDTENGILVLYDARFESEIENINWLEESKWNTKIYKPPFILFLRSENASSIATKTVEEKFKSKKDAPKKK